MAPECSTARNLGHLSNLYHHHHSVCLDNDSSERSSAWREELEANLAQDWLVATHDHRPGSSCIERVVSKSPVRDCVLHHTLKLYPRLQYRNAKALLAEINKKRPPKESYYRHCLNAIAFAFFIPFRILDWIRVSGFGRFLVRKGLVRDRSLSEADAESAFAKDSDARREPRFQAKMEDTNMTWTMSMAFYALSGGCVYVSKTGEQRIMRGNAIAYLAECEPQSLLQLQRVVLQNPGKANAIGKAITCVQAFWFCSQCIARLSGGLAVSLLELNTFAHCISTILIYIFWWEKPYDVETHSFIESGSLDFCFLLELNNLRESPGVYFPYEHGVNRRGRHECSVYDSEGNCLTHWYNWTFSLPIPFFYEDDYLVRFNTGSKIRISNTELYVAFAFLAEVPTVVVCRPWQTQWERFWSAWVKLNQPLPIKSLSMGKHWFYSSTNGSPDIDTDLIERFEKANFRLMMVLNMTLTFMVYGGLHLLAWQYNFNSTSALYLWRISAVVTTSTGLVLLTLSLAGISARAPFVAGSRLKRAFFRSAKAELDFCHWASVGLRWFSYFMLVLNVASRAFLVIESFIALPNAPRSTYTIPTWTSYIPHI